jgi:multicomponent Na+:H+ antiporter subunit D
MWVVVILIVSTLLNIAYLLPPVWKAFFNPVDPHAGGKAGVSGEGAEAGEVKEAPWACVVPVCLTAAGCVALFLWPDVLIRLAGFMIER